MTRRWHATTFNEQFETFGNTVSEYSFELTRDEIHTCGALVLHNGDICFCFQTQPFVNRNLHNQCTVVIVPMCVVLSYAIHSKAKLFQVVFNNCMY